MPPLFAQRLPRAERQFGRTTRRAGYAGGRSSSRPVASQRRRRIEEQRAVDFVGVCNRLRECIAHLHLETVGEAARGLRLESIVIGGAERGHQGGIRRAPELPVQARPGCPGSRLGPVQLLVRLLADSPGPTYAACPTNPNFNSRCRVKLNDST